MFIKPPSKIGYAVYFAVLLLGVCLSACGEKKDAGDAGNKAAGQNGQEVRTKAFGIDYSTEFSLENPEQIVCGQDCMWAITTRLDGFIYRIDYKEENSGVQEIEWRTGGEENLVNIAEGEKGLYASVYLRKENQIEIRRLNAGGQWTVIMTVKAENPEWCVVGSGLFVDSGENTYMVSDRAVTCFGENGTKTGEYELEGRACFFRENDDGGVECVAAKTDSIVLYGLNGAKAEEKWALQVDGGKVCGISGGKEAPLCLAADTVLLFIDWETGSLLEKSDLLAMGVSFVLAGRYDAKEETLRLYGAGGQSEGSGNLSCSLLSGREASAEQRTELVYGIFYGEAPADIKAAIMAFNRSNESYYITIRSYCSNTTYWQESQQRFLADMAAQNAPDIIDMLFWRDYYEPFVSSGYLENLTPYLEQSQYKDDIMWNVLSAYEVDGSLYLLAPQFSFTGLLIHPEYACPLEDWNTETFLTMLQRNAWKKNVFNIYQSNPQDLLRNMLIGRQGELIDKEQKKAYFESQAFLDMLALCKEYAENHEAGEDDLLNYNNLFSRRQYGFYHDYVFSTDIYGREYQIYGYPTADGQVYQVFSSDSLAIYAGSTHKEGAWQFVESLLQEENQVYHAMTNPGIPIRRSVLERMKEEEGWKEMAYRVGDELLTTSEAEFQIVENIIANGIFVPENVNEDIWSIIEEETAAYFAGDKSAEEVAHIIQSRVGLMLAE
ncbi:MAG: extracellular solute-binding protein [Lachnospiraceae bacterium]